ncbi:MULTISPECIES: NADPH-dependent assimilatory sulfite reductase hemoprotein subunit [Nitrosomonas]|uniref:Sulfite reductase [NADPH] hemoprotein beta-component n=1 Tax=Nitrosomonas europaea (strain ATCC 19718 / CIP 103999 / KCTC 2705 / NBRC 14298) TaxID=228410 RepID=CYSI_NITEU|nr:MULTISPECIES: NADPH-dependent assimilatory sulfite reductase hemoprotein subunit [Nitrosomonas]Q82W45.1 RecName: Full=Sulfite reductase [NADPH] hemoprotein beta-component; Short=SiR-HP; Short=SiRHP [Nitrosomonas europaea ATCC 19718]CAD84763.1 Nitrite and sulfite reductase [Nitrosomonas europaea ATCC 19718]SDW16360.1 sulfite reductase (NADPH) beta subunit [Nitrosomonas europaea]SES77798.1 sulfite reductase (NADPH) beta subunit [Nitrosomonas europaea]SJZ34632.1 sulfite reductase (NADPH) beta 
MANTLPPTDRSCDISQPLERLSPDESLKAESDYLRGTIALGLLDRITSAVPGNDIKLMKFHGIYEQDDREIRDERRRQKLEPAFQFMIRVRLPGGICTTERWLKISELACAHGNETLRMTTRQTFQFHWVLKQNIVPLIRGLHEVLLDTVAACGDDSRGVMATVNPQFPALQAELAALAKTVSDHVIPKTRAYHEIWYGEERIASSEPEEPFYGQTYMPRKFKIGFVIPPNNDIDIYAQDLGYIAIIGENGKIAGFNVAIGGGMGRTDKAPHTYPRTASVIGFITPDRLISVTEAVMGVQRDYGNRADRSRARFKYTIDDKGLDWIKLAIEDRAGPLESARPYDFTSNADIYGWIESGDGFHHFTLFIENGRLNRDMLDKIAQIAHVHKGHFRLTPNQNLMIANVATADKPEIEALLRETGLIAFNERSVLRLNSMACVALPTCGLAMADSERYLPDLITKIEGILTRYNLQNEPITLRMTGCPNGCSRPFIAEIGLTGRAPGKYNLYLGGGFHGQRLNRLYRENIGEPAILETLNEVLGRYATERLPDEHFGDFTIRAGIIREVTEGRFSND